MTKKQILEALEKVNALRDKRLVLADLILSDSSNMKPLIEIVFEVDSDISIKAAWVLEFVVKKEFCMVLPFIDYLSVNIQKIHYGGAVRSMAKITQIIMQHNDKKQFLSIKQEDLFVEIVFDWLISNHKVAIKAYSMDILFRLGKKKSWVHPELKNILQENIQKYSPAYKARARITLEQIKKFDNKKKRLP